MNLLERCNPDLISVPNTFTPNNDGFNDDLQLISNTITDINTFQIFDRWGGLVFETNDFYQPWDGKRNGEDMPVGVYVYFVEATCFIDGTKFLKKGDVTILK
jgi:gliding motility-associated-like protein